jgi:hypothetical protein
VDSTACVVLTRDSKKHAPENAGNRPHHQYAVLLNHLFAFYFGLLTALHFIITANRSRAFLATVKWLLYLIDFPSVPNRQAIVEVQQRHPQ